MFEYICENEYKLIRLPTLKDLFDINDYELTFIYKNNFIFCNQTLTVNLNSGLMEHMTLIKIHTMLLAIPFFISFWVYSILFMKNVYSSFLH